MTDFVQWWADHWPLLVLLLPLFLLPFEFKHYNHTIGGRVFKGYKVRLGVLYFNREREYRVVDEEQRLVNES